MNERDAFLKQAASDLRVFRLLLNVERPRIPACHPLHYLQMASEKLAKAVMIALAQPPESFTHVAFSRLPILLARTDIARRLGWQSGRTLRRFLKKASPIFREIDELHPGVGTQDSLVVRREQPNVEYPWQARGQEGIVRWHVPAEYDWSLINRLQRGEGAQVLQFIERLTDRFDSVFS